MLNTHPDIDVTIHTKGQLDLAGSPIRVRRSVAYSPRPGDDGTIVVGRDQQSTVPVDDHGLSGRAVVVDLRGVPTVVVANRNGGRVFRPGESPETLARGVYRHVPIVEGRTVIELNAESTVYVVVDRVPAVLGRNTGAGTGTDDLDSSVAAKFAARLNDDNASRRRVARSDWAFFTALCVRSIAKRTFGEKWAPPPKHIVQLLAVHCGDWWFAGKNPPGVYDGDDLGSMLDRLKIRLADIEGSIRYPVPGEQTIHALDDEAAGLLKARVEAFYRWAVIHNIAEICDRELAEAMHHTLDALVAEELSGRRTRNDDLDDLLTPRSAG